MILQGDCLDQLKTLPAESVDCCITSPPYYGLRDYGVSGQIGLESSPDYLTYMWIQDTGDAGSESYIYVPAGEFGMPIQEAGRLQPKISVVQN